MNRLNDQLTLEEINEKIAQLREQLDNQERSTQASVRNIEASTEEVASAVRFVKKVRRKVFIAQKVTAWILLAITILFALCVFGGIIVD